MEATAAVHRSTGSEPSVATRHLVLLVLVSVFAYFATRITALLHTAVGEGLFSLLFGGRFIGFYWPWLPVTTAPSGVAKAFIDVAAQPSSAVQILFSFGGVLTTAVAGSLLILWLSRRELQPLGSLFFYLVAVLLLLDLPTALLARAGYLKFVERSWGLPGWVFTSLGLILIAVLVWWLSKGWLRRLAAFVPVRGPGSGFLAFLSTVFAPFYLLPQVLNLIFGRFDEPFFRTGAVWACLILAFIIFLLLPKRLFPSRGQPNSSTHISLAVLTSWVAAMLVASFLGSLVFGTGEDYFRLKGLFWSRYRAEEPAFGNLTIRMMPDGTAEVVAKLRPSLPAEAWWSKLYRTSPPSDWRSYLAAFQWNVTGLLGLNTAAIRGLGVETDNQPEVPFYLFEHNSVGARVLRATVNLRSVVRRQSDTLWLSIGLASKREINWEEVRISAADSLEIEGYEAAIPPLRVPRRTLVGEAIGYLGLPDQQRAQPVESNARDLMWRRSKASEMPANIRVRFRLKGSQGLMTPFP